MYKKLIISLLFIITLAFQAIGQNSTEKEPYILDTSQLNTLSIFMDALKERSINNNKTAYELYKICVNKDPNNAAANFELAQTAMIEKDYNTTIKCSKKAYELDPDNKYYRDFYIEILSRSGEPSEAIAVLDKLVKEPNVSDEIKIQYVGLLTQNKQYKKALATLSEFEKNGEYSDIISYEKVKIYILQKDDNKAEEELKKMIKNNPGNTDVMKYLAEFYMETEQMDKANQVFDDILRIEPNNADALIYKSQFYAMDGDKENYEKYLMKLIDSKDLTMDTKISLIADKFSKSSDIDSSDKTFLYTIAQKLIEQYPDDYRSYQVQGDMYYLYKNYDQALSSYQKSLKIEESDFNVWQNLFYTLNAMKNYQELADSTKAALEYFPANALVYLYNGLANVELNKYDDAEKSFNRGLRFVGDNKAMEYTIYGALGDLYYRMKDYKMSDQSFEEAIKLDPNNAYTLNNYAYYLSLRADRLEEAKKMSKKSIDLDNRNSSFYDTYAWIMFQLKDYSTAKFYQEKAIEYGKEDMSTIYDHYGDILIKLNQKDKAIEYWKKAKDSGSDNTVLDQKISTSTYIKNPKD